MDDHFLIVAYCEKTEIYSTAYPRGPLRGRFPKEYPLHGFIKINVIFTTSHQHATLLSNYLVLAMLYISSPQYACTAVVITVINILAIILPSPSRIYLLPIMKKKDSEYDS